MTIVDIVSLVFSAAAVVFSVFTYWANIIHDRKQATLNAYNQLQEQAIYAKGIKRNSKKSKN